MPYFQTTDNASIHYNDWGTGAPVLLIHGWPLSAAMWEQQAYFLAREGFRVITYDRRGFGRSSQTWQGYGYDTLAADLHGLIEHLDLSDLSLVGFSMGGGEVVRYLSRHGAKRVRAAALISAVTPFLMKASDNPEGVDPEVFGEMITSLEKDRAHFLADFNKKFFGVGALSHPVSQEVLDWSLALELQGSLKATVDCVRSFSATDFRSELPAITVPTLVIHGDEDVTVPANVAGKQAARLLRDATLKIYEGAPHGLFMTHADKLNLDLREFLIRAGAMTAQR